MLYGCRLNRITRVSASACNAKPLSNIVEATITRATGGSQRSKHLSNVFVVDTNKQPLNTIHPGEARLLLNKGKAAVLKKYPFTIILNVAIDDPVVAELRIKIDPGSKTTGIAIVNDQSGEVVFAAELAHRGQQIKSDLDDRRGVRRGRRNRHTRYRKPRWQNRRRPQGLVTTIFAEPDSQRHHLGTAACKSLPYHKYQHGACQVRHASSWRMLKSQVCSTSKEH